MKKLCKAFITALIMLLAMNGANSHNVVWADANLTECIDLTNISSDCTGQGWFWDAQKKIWTLSGLDLINTKQANVLVLLPADTVIHLEAGSTNKITSSAKRIILANGDLTIEGAGQLILDGNYNVENQAIRVLGNLTISDADLKVYNCGDSIACQAPNEIEDGWLVEERKGEYGNISIMGSNIVMENVFGGVRSAEDQQISRSTITIKNSSNWGIYSMKGKVTCEKSILSMDKVSNGIIAAAATITNSELTISQRGTEGSGILLISWNIKEPLTDIRNLDLTGGKLEIQSDGAGIYLGPRQLLNVEDGNVVIDSNYCAVMGIISGDVVDEKKVQLKRSSVQLAAPVSVMVAQMDRGSKVREMDNVIYIAQDMRYETEYYYETFKMRIAALEGEDTFLYALLPQETTLGGTLSGDDNVAAGELLVNSMEGKGELKLVPKKDSSATKKEAIAVYVNGQAMAIDPANDGSVYIDENGRTIVPLRALAGALGIAVEWDSEKQTITIPNGPKGTVVFTIGSKEYSMDGTVKTMDTTAVSLPPGRTHVPLRFVAESLGAQVEMRSEADGTAKIMITTNK